MRIFGFLFISLIGHLLYGAELKCQILLNGELAFTNVLQTHQEFKTAIGKIPAVTAYVTEKENSFFSVEAFLGSEEVRIYGEAYARTTNDRISATLWSRQNLVEVKCVRL
jgi:hypothetical protein